MENNAGNQYSSYVREQSGARDIPGLFILSSQVTKGRVSGSAIRNRGTAFKFAHRLFVPFTLAVKQGQEQQRRLSVNGKASPVLLLLYNPLAAEFHQKLIYDRYYDKRQQRRTNQTADNSNA